MPTTREIKNKIKTVNNTKKITNAMELVSISKIRRCQDKMEALRPYKAAVLDLIGHLAYINSSHKAFHINKSATDIGYILMGTDRGLCGGLNINMFKEFTNHLKQNNYSTHQVHALTFGRKALTFTKSIGIKSVAHAAALEHPDIRDVFAQVLQITNSYFDGKISKVFVVGNDYINTMTQQPRILQILPITPHGLEQRKSKWTYQFEPSKEEIEKSLILRYLESVVYEMLLENVACEQAARMIAMKNASENATDMIYQMNQLFNRRRQAAITQEIAEIVGGANAIS